MAVTADALGTNPANVYRAFIEALNRQDLDAVTRLVNTLRYHEHCVGFTHGFVNWEGANQSFAPSDLEGSSESARGLG